MRRCPGDGDPEVKKCVHSVITKPPRVIWSSVAVPLKSKGEMTRWETGRYEAVAREQWLRLPEGFEWTSEEILWHASDVPLPQREGASAVLWAVVVSRAVRKLPK